MKIKLLLLLFVGSLFMQSCFMRKKNRCNTCPKWSKVEKHPHQEDNKEDV